MSKTNESLMQRRHAAVPRGVGQIHPIFAASAKNATVTDVEGREFIDFAGGIAVLNTGHLHPKIIAAVQEQLTKLSHTCFQVLAYEPYVELCEKINAKVPGDFDKKTLLVTTGSEAVENAVKIARAATGRAGVIAFTGAYHGRTMMTLGLTGKVVPYSAGMGLMPGGIFRALYPCELHGVSVDDSIASIERIFKNDAEPKDIAAIIIEPVQGEGGFYVAPKAFMLRLRELCDKHGILLILDEVQAGFGRTGKMFAFEHAEIEPDVIVMSKAVGGGLPLAVLGFKREFDAWSPGNHAGTFRGNQMAMATGLATLEVLQRQNLAGQAAKRGDWLKEQLGLLQQRYPAIGNVRGRGLMLGIEIVDERKAADRLGSLPMDPELAVAIQQHCFKQGLLLERGGRNGNVIRLLPPLIITEEQCQLVIQRFEQALKAALSQLRK
ncbi:diaminobutyrate--2-oxoglutarate transaminase family protein [Pseudomonas syringae]|uniref:diaminobutyrate--2-oxoglutarate transaminase family protein n=3 Tax=Pseudomonas syringae group TaxID=136849 RepID=UPI001071E555|nr:diaminobutyrate--2-oxoglutarate transaminase family protein [Pseudomonas syringae]